MDQSSSYKVVVKPVYEGVKSIVVIGQRQAYHARRMRRSIAATIYMLGNVSPLSIQLCVTQAQKTCVQAKLYTRKSAPIIPQLHLQIHLAHLAIQKMANANTILRIAKFPLSLLLIALSIVIFYFTADAFRNIGRDYPATVNDASRYVWKEGVTWDDFIHKRYHTVNLHYDWTNENLMWIVGGSCIIAGVLSLADAVVQQWRTMKGSSKVYATHDFYGHC